jgi:hypothetical protein
VTLLPPLLPFLAIRTDLLHALLYKIKFLVIQEDIPLMEGREVPCPTVPLSKLADVTITSAFPLEVGVQATKALTMAGFCTRSGGTILWVAPQKEAGPILPLIKEMASDETAAHFHRRLIEGNVPDHLKSFGIPNIIQILYFKESAEKFSVHHVTKGLSPEQVKTMKFSYVPELQKAIGRISSEMPKADVRFFRQEGISSPKFGDEFRISD